MDRRGFNMFIASDFPEVSGRSFRLPSASALAFGSGRRVQVSTIHSVLPSRCAHLARFSDVVLARRALGYPALDEVVAWQPLVDVPTPVVIDDLDGDDVFIS